MRMMSWPLLNKQTFWKWTTQKFQNWNSTTKWKIQSVQFSCSALSKSLQPHGLQHAKLPCPSPAPWACSNSCSTNWWWHASMASSIVPFASYLQSFPALGFFSNELVFCIRWPKDWSWAFASVLPMNINGWFPLGLTGLISLLFKGFSRIFSNTTVQKHQFFGTQPSLWSNSHICTWLLEKNT